MNIEILIKFALCVSSSGAVAFVLNRKTKVISLIGFSLVWGFVSWMLVLILNTRFELNSLHTFFIAAFYALFIYKSYLSDFILGKYIKLDK